MLPKEQRTNVVIVDRQELTISDNCYLCVCTCAQCKLNSKNDTEQVELEKEEKHKEEKHEPVKT